MADHEETSTTRPLRPAVPVYDGPLASSGAAPDPAPLTVPRPRPGEPDAKRELDARPEPDAGPEPVARVEPEPDTRPAPDAKVEPTAEAEAAPAAKLVSETAAVELEVKAEPVTVIDLDVPAVGRVGANRRIRVPFAHATGWRSPGAAAASGARAVRAWSRRPSGRLTLPALLLFAMVAATAATGAFVIPATAHTTATEPTTEPSSPAPEPTGFGFPTNPGGLPSGLPSTPPVGTSSLPAPPWNAVGGRPSDVLAGWASQVSARVGVPAVAMQAYGYAQLQLSQTSPGCRLSWTTLAAIGQVESGHGHANGAVLGSNGVASPEIIGLPLDGNGGRMRILDTEDGRLDQDATYDRAVGPMQFIPTTWEQDGADGDGDGVKNPHSIDDAALAAGNYLCKGGRNLSVPSDWWNAILSYNDVRPYAQSVFDTANRYGRDSRT